MSAKQRTMEPEVRTVLETAEVGDDGVLRLAGQLDPALYKRVDAALRTLGGRWDRRRGGHVWADGSDPRDAVGDAVEAAAYVDPRLNGYFPTPPALAADVAMWAAIEPGLAVLEPSAGKGALADPVRALGAAVTCCELLEPNVRDLERKGYAIAARDFLAYAPGRRFDRVVMNPPFTRGADAAHLLRAWDLVAPGGRLVSIVSAMTMRRETARDRAVQALADGPGGRWWELPDDSFAEVGTQVQTAVVLLDKDDEEEVA